MADGTEFVTLLDAANWIIDNKPPYAEKAMQRLMDAGNNGGSIEAAETAIRLALFTKLDYGRDR